MPEPLGEDKKKGKPEKLKRCIRTAAGSSWEDPSLLEWDAGEWPEQEAGYYPSKNRLHSVFRATNMEKEAGDSAVLEGRTLLTTLGSGGHN